MDGNREKKYVKKIQPNIAFLGHELIKFAHTFYFENETENMLFCDQSWLFWPWVNKILHPTLKRMY